MCDEAVNDCLLKFVLDFFIKKKMIRNLLKFFTNEIRNSLLMKWVL